MNDNTKKWTALALFALMVGCGSDDFNKDSSIEDSSIEDSAASALDPSSGQSMDADQEAACAVFPNLPFCSDRELQPGFAKFAVGRADAVRWSGKDGCREIDFRTGRQGEDKLTVAVGEIRSVCRDTSVHFEFVYRRHTDTLGKDTWTSAFRPLDTRAANQLIDSCTPSTRPKLAEVLGEWWKANNTYAENLMLNYIAPLPYATQLLPFDDDGIERLGEADIEGVSTVAFRNDVATVWMIAGDQQNRPVRVVRHSNDTEVQFTEWDEPFAATIPGDMRSLSEVCSVN